MSLNSNYEQQLQGTYCSFIRNKRGMSTGDSCSVVRELVRFCYVTSLSTVTVIIVVGRRRFYLEFINNMWCHYLSHLELPLCVFDALDPGCKGAGDSGIVPHSQKEPNVDNLWLGFSVQRCRTNPPCMLVTDGPV